MTFSSNSPSSVLVAALLAVSMTATSTGCVRNIPAPSPPEPSMPETYDDEVPEGEGGMARVVISTDTVAKVDRLAGHFDTTRRGRIIDRTYRTDVDALLCASTPCTVSLPYGDYDLHFQALGDSTRVSSATIHVRHRTEVVNHVLGQNKSNGVGTFGGVIAVIGLLALSTGIAIGLADPRASASSTNGSTMAALVGTGGITAIIGGAIMAASPSTHQEGATRQWAPRSLPAAAPTPVAPAAAKGASIRVTF